MANFKFQHKKNGQIVAGKMLGKDPYGHAVYPYDPELEPLFDYELDDNGNFVALDDETIIGTIEDKRSQ